MSREIDRLMWVAHNMPEECKLALERFVRVNPAWNGANWEDCLDVLLDSDSHLDVTEPLYEALGTMSSEIGVTLLWAMGGAPTIDEVRPFLERCVLEQPLEPPLEPIGFIKPVLPPRADNQRPT